MHNRLKFPYFTFYTHQEKSIWLHAMQTGGRLFFFSIKSVQTPPDLTKVDEWPISFLPSAQLHLIWSMPTKDMYVCEANSAQPASHNSSWPPSLQSIESVHLSACQQRLGHLVPIADSHHYRKLTTLPPSTLCWPAVIYALQMVTSISWDSTSTSPSPSPPSTITPPQAMCLIGM